MKKILSILLAVALCATFTVCAFAADADSTKVSDEVLGDIVDGLGDLINAETDENDAALEKAIEELYAALNDANAKGDTSALIEQLKDYANGADVDNLSVSRAGCRSNLCFKAVRNTLLADCYSVAAGTGSNGNNAVLFASRLGGNSCTCVVFNVCAYVNGFNSAANRAGQSEDTGCAVIAFAPGVLV